MQVGAGLERQPCGSPGLLDVESGVERMPEQGFPELIEDRGVGVSVVGRTDFASEGDELARGLRIRNDIVLERRCKSQNQLLIQEWRRRNEPARTQRPMGTGAPDDQDIPIGAARNVAKLLFPDLCPRGI